MASREEDFKERFVAMLQDFRSNGDKDPEAMFLIGSLAARLVDRARQPSWAAFKANMVPPVYDKLLSDFQKQGNDFHKEGKAKHAYAIQVLAMSLVARTQKDAQVRTGEGLLDEMLGLLIASYRKAEATKPKVN
ncbi:MAG: hypothetical protein JWQ89_1398 [Devosia sp.]|uniref:hypothetical protein n=1 Tax=Devosia sp. TaxID=1871048 RepID=UPI00262A43D3|nr:hypothetical protein [Devosia sp.]MDB5539671.1 hypothetical protein [Devosia sp.]